jgi:APA family basic amino acid/polyamine antiporter
MPDSPSSVRRLTLFDAAMIVVSGIIGSGIFINPHVTATIVHTPFLIVAVWVAGGLLALAGAFVFAELGTVMPEVGGQYAFMRRAFHPIVGFLHGWSLLMLIQSGAMAAVAVILGQYLAHLLGLADAVVTPIAIAMLIGLGAFHALGIKPGAILVDVITFTKTIVLAALIIGAFMVSVRSGLDFHTALPSACR